MLKPQDIVLALHLLQGEDLNQSEMGQKVGLSQPEVSNCLRRLRASSLLLSDSRRVVIPHLVEVCVHGVKYFFPPELGNRRGGIPTLALAAPLKGIISGDDLDLIWPAPRGTARANSLLPLHPCAVQAALNDERVYELLVLLDGMRVGKARVRGIAEDLFRKRVQNKEQHHATGR